MKGSRVQLRLVVLEPLLEPQRHTAMAGNASRAVELAETAFRDFSPSLAVRGVLQEISVRSLAINSNSHPQNIPGQMYSEYPSYLRGLSILTDTEIPEVNSSASEPKIPTMENQSPPRKNLRERYHLISSLESPQNPGGWAVLDNMSSDGFEVYKAMALAVRTRVASRGFKKPSFLDMGKKIYDIILVEASQPGGSLQPPEADSGLAETPRYRRLGMGCAVGSELLRQFERGRETVLELI
jgi:hypothetical protein